MSAVVLHRRRACLCAVRTRVVVPLLLLAVATTANSVLYPGLAGAAASTWTPVSALALLSATAAVAVLAR